MGKSYMRDKALAIAVAVLLAGVLLAAYYLTPWVMLGSGLVFIALWVWVRLETGAWVDDFSEIRVILTDSDRQDSPRQPRRP